MQAIGNLLKSNPNGMSFEEIAKETLNDPDIKEWVSDMDGVEIGRASCRERV